MDYIELIEKRQSVRAFDDAPVAENLRAEIRGFFDKEKRLAPDFPLKLAIVDGDAKNRLEGVAGYRGFAFGAPAYLVLLTGRGERMAVNAGYIGESLLLKAVDLGLDTCWITVNDAEVVKKALLMDDEELTITVIIAIGYGKKQGIEERLDIVNPSEVRLKTRAGYAAPKMAPEDITYIDTWGNSPEWDKYTVDPIVETALYAASLAPTFLNRQPIRYVVAGKRVVLCITKEELVTEDDNFLNIGIAMFHFAAPIESRYASAGKWILGAPDNAASFGIPEAYTAVAYFEFNY